MTYESYKDNTTFVMVKCFHLLESVDILNPGLFFA